MSSIRRFTTATGSTRFHVTIDLEPHPGTGRRRQARRSFKTRREAERGLATLLVELDAGGPAKLNPTIAEVATGWLREYVEPRLRQNTIKQYTWLIRDYIVPRLGAVKARDLRPVAVQRFYAELRRDGVPPYTTYLTHACLRAFMRHAVRLEIVPRNPTEGVAPKKPPSAKRVTWGREQCRVFLDAARTDDLAALWLLVLSTGLRGGELLGLRWRDVHWDRGTLRVEQQAVRHKGGVMLSDPKTAAAKRTLHIGPAVLSGLREHRARQNEERLRLGEVWHDADLIFAGDEGWPMSPERMRAGLNRLIAASGLPRLSMHDLRHSQISLALDAGMDIKVVSEAAGHVSVLTTLNIYAHTNPEQHRRLAETMEQALKEGADG